MQEKTTYKSSGVDIEAGNAFVERLKEKVPTIGGFGGMYKVCLLYTSDAADE